MCGRLPQTCPSWSRKGNVSRNKWHWTLRQQMLHIYMGPATAAQGQKPSSYSPESRNARGPLWMNDMLTGLRCSTFETFSFCLMAKVLAASLSAQQLQMLCCDRQIPLSPPSPWDCADGTRCPAHIGAHLTHGAENEGAKFLRMVKRYNLSVLLAALVMLENYRFSIPELHLTQISVKYIATNNQ